MKIREAAWGPALVAALIQFIVPFFTKDQETVTLINAALALLAGLVTAFLVSAEKGLALLVASGNTIVQLALGFGLTLTDGQQTVFATILTLIAAGFTRTQVVAPVAAVPVQRVAAPAQVINRQTGG